MALRAARDRNEEQVAIEVDAVGAPASFDGNFSNRVISWLIPYPGQTWEGLDDQQVEQLMDWTVKGHLQWVVFPIDNLSMTTS